MTVLSQFGGFVGNVDSVLGPDGQSSVVMVVHLDSGVAQAEAFRINRDLSWSSIGRSESLGKDSSVSGVVFPDGMFRMFVTEADPGSSGMTTKVHVYDFPNALPPGVFQGSVDIVARNAVNDLKNKLRSV